MHTHNAADTTRLLCTLDSPGTTDPGLFGVSVTYSNSRRPCWPLLLLHRVELWQQVLQDLLRSHKIYIDMTSDI